MMNLIRYIIIIIIYSVLIINNSNSFENKILFKVNNEIITSLDILDELEYLKAINTTKENVMDNDDKMWEKRYASFIVNKCLAPFNDTVMLVNEMNFHHHLDNKLQYDFLLNSVRRQNRYAPWMKASKTKNLEYVKEFFGYNNEKAKSALNILNDEQIAYIKTKLKKGGKNE